MAALTDLLTFLDNQETNKLKRQQAEVEIEAKRRADNAAAVERGKAMSLRDNIVSNMADIENSQIELDRIDRQYANATSNGPLPDEWEKQYRDARAAAEANLIMHQSVARRLYVEKGMMDGSLDKTVAKAAEPMYTNIFDPKRDPYDQIEEERKTKTENAETGVETEVTRKGPASAFNNENGPDTKLSNAYTSSFDTPLGRLFGGRKTGIPSIEGAPEISYRPVREQNNNAGSTDIEGATPVDVTSSQPNPSPVASQQTNPSAPAPKTGGFVRVRNKATGQTGYMPKSNWDSGNFNSQYEEIP